jgi:hypothetical protein
VTIHCFCIDAMQNLGSQSFQLCDIWLCLAVLDGQSNCERGLPIRNAENKMNII